jgi:hypothetical protein
MTEIDPEREVYETIPAPPPAPSHGPLHVDPLADISRRLGELSDALHDPEGLVHRLFADSEEVAERRFNTIMTALAAINKTVTDIADAQIELAARLTPVETGVDRHEAELVLIRSNGNGNGKGHG